MARLNFFADGDDQRSVLRLIFERKGLRVFESYSEYDQELREFTSVEELEAAFTLGADRHGKGYAVLLQLWSPEITPEFHFRRINLKPKSVPGHTFRYCVESPLLIQLYLGGLYEVRPAEELLEGARRASEEHIERLAPNAIVYLPEPEAILASNVKKITQCHFGHFSREGARKWGHEDKVDWKALSKVSNQIQYHIRSRLAVARVPGCPILPGALDRFYEGYALDGYPSAQTLIETKV